MADKKIEIKMAVSGAEQAADQIQKVQEAASSAADATSPSAQDITKDILGPRFEELKRKADALTESANDVGESLDQNVGEINMRSKAEALGRLGAGFGMLANFTKDSADMLRERSPEIAQALDNITTGLDSVSGGLTMAAQGFAVGGPLGGAIGTMAGVTIPLLRKEFDLLQESLHRLAEAETQADQLTRTLSQQMVMGVEAYDAAVEASENYREKTDELNRSLQIQNQELKFKNDLLNATAKAESAVRDAQDAARIKAGEAPEDVQADRARYDAEKKIESERAKVNELIAEQEAAARRKDQSAENVRSFKNDPRGNQDPKEMQRLLDEETKARQAYEDATFRSTSGLSVFNQRKIEITQTSQNKVAELEDQKSKRLQREQEDEQRYIQRQQEEDQKYERDRLQQELEERQDRLNTGARDAAGTFAAKSRVGGDLGKTLSGISRRLEDGTNEGELKALAAQFSAATKGMGKGTIAMLREMLSAQLAQAKEIETLRKQIKAK